MLPDGLQAEGALLPGTPDAMARLPERSSSLAKLKPLPPLKGRPSLPDLPFTAQPAKDTVGPLYAPADSVGQSHRGHDQRDIEEGIHEAGAAAKDQKINTVLERTQHLPQKPARRWQATKCSGCACVVLTAIAVVGITVMVMPGKPAWDEPPPCKDGQEIETSFGVSMVVGLAFEKSAFTAEQQRLFVSSVARASKVHECAVEIISIQEKTSVRRSGGIHVEFKVFSANATDAGRIAGMLNSNSLQHHFSEHGFLAVTTVQQAAVFAHSDPSAPPSSGLCPAGYTGAGIGSCLPCDAGTYKATAGSAPCSECPQGHSSPPASTRLLDCTQVDKTPRSIPMSEVREHATDSSCWVVVHAKVVDVTGFRGKHPGGRDKIMCGTDLTDRFQIQHGPLSSLMSRLALPAFSADLKLLGDLQQDHPTAPAPAVSDASSTQFDFSNVVKKPHPGSGAEFKTLVYIELKGAWDSASGFLNHKTDTEVHLWCAKRPTLSASDYCECAEMVGNVCEKYVLRSGAQARVFPMDNTGGYLAMTDLLASGDTGWLSLWNSGKMSIVPGVGRRDHARSHFEVKDAAAKGVSVEEEKHTTNGWLAKSIFAYKNLYCGPGSDCPSGPGSQPPMAMVDAISLAQAAAGPNALEMSEAVGSIKRAQGSSVAHMTGVKSVDAVLEAMGANYINPFTMQGGEALRRLGVPAINAKDFRDDGVRQQSVRQTDEELWAVTQTNQGLEDLLIKESTIFRGLGILQDKLDGYIANLPVLCPVSTGNTGFPEITEWADSESDAEIGMQLRAVAILLVNGVVPKVFQLQQTKYDTHSNQGPRLRTLLSDLKTGVYTFVKAAENCNFWDDVLVASFTDFGRRLEENSRAGTDHGWGATNVVFGKDLRTQVFGYNHASNSSALSDIIPFHADAYDPGKATKGDLQMTTDVETWNACILNALALPALPRLSTCPPELRLRDGLAVVPMFHESRYYAAAVGQPSSESTPPSLSPPPPPSPLTGDGDRSHLNRALSRGEVLHFARRVGFSAKSFGLDRYLLPASANSTLPSLTLQQAISLVLAPNNTHLGHGNEAPPPKIYVDYVPRQHNPIKLWSRERREKRNNWEDLMKLPFPRYDPIERRLRRWGLEKFFDLTSIVDSYPGSIQVKPEYAGREEQILQHLQTNATVFFLPKPASHETAKPDKNLLDANMNIKDVSKVNWYATIMTTPNVKELLNLSFAQIVDDWRCNNSTGTHPMDSSIPCDPGCDLTDFLTIDYEAKTAMITDLNQKGPDGTFHTSKWKRLQSCVKTESQRKQYEVERYNQIKSEVKSDLFRQYFLDFTDTRYGLRARMAWFFLNWYATPASAVNDWLLMYKQYYTIWTGALGSFRTLSRKMFVDGALRKSLDQFEEVECGTAPIENFSREWFERFTVGNRAHNEGDIKRLAKGLMNCKDDAETANADLMTPGIIFTDTSEILWTLTESEQHMIVDRILDSQKVDSEPPAAAQFLCAKLYNEFGHFPKETSSASSVGSPQEVVSCARYLTDHNYDITFALEHIFQDKENFRDGFGTKKRWPLATILEPMIDYDIFNARAFATPDTWAPIWAGRVGMPAFEPQDVSGFDLDTVWTLDRLTKAHEFRSEVVQWIARDAFTREDFESVQSMEAALAPYSLGPASPTKYAYSVRLCGPDLFVDSVGTQGNHTVDASGFFERYPNKAARLKAWRDAVSLALNNVCQFVC